MATMDFDSDDTRRQAMAALWSGQPMPDDLATRWQAPSAGAGTTPFSATPSSATPTNGTAREAALQQFASVYGQYGREVGADEQQDFDNLWRQSREGSTFGGAGLDHPTGAWTDVLAGYQPQIAARLGPAGGGNGGGAGSGGGTLFANPHPSFSDPATQLIENYALDRFQQRQNPNPNSGTAQYEQYAKQLIDALKQPVYSSSDEAILKTGATDAMERERGQTKQRWIEEMSRRGIPPSSGVALDGLRKIEEHYNGLRTQVDAQFAREAIGRTRDQRTQVLDVLGQLAGSEEGRLREAGTYAAIPQQLLDNAFQRNLQLTGGAGNPGSTLNSILALNQANQNASATQSQNRSAFTSGLLQLLGALGG